MKDYILIKLRSGEEIIATVMSKNRSGIKVFRPMQIRQIPFVDHVSGNLKAAVVMENWIGRTDANEVIIPNNWVGVKMLPSQDVIDVYEKQMVKEDVLPAEATRTKKDLLKDLPKDPPEPCVAEVNHLKKLEEEIDKLIGDIIGDNGVDGVTSADFFTPMMDPMIGGKMGKGDKEVVVVNFMFPPSIFKQMMEEGLIEDFLTAGMSMPENGDDSMDDEDDVFQPKSEKAENQIKENDVDIREKGDEPYGNSYRDWSSNPSDYL